MFKKKRIRAVFKHHLAKNVVDQILENDSVLSLDAEIKHLTILFCDILVFTFLSERYTEQEILELLYEYKTDMVDVILRYGGMFDKFVGDEIMAEFGLPVPFSDHAERACLAALEMARSFDLLRDRWMQDGKETFGIQIGIHTGNMPAGNIGAKQIFDYTVIGHEVTRGVRLMSANRVYQTANSIIISEATKNELSNKIVTRELDNVRFKGLTQSDVIFELVGENENVVYSNEFLAHYNEGLANYKKQEWDNAIIEFKKAFALTEDNVSKLYISRCKHLIENPPPSDWDGVFTFMTK